VIRSAVRRAPGLTLFGVIRGLVSEIPPLLAGLNETRPSAIAVGVPPEELAGISGYFVDRSVEPLVPLSENETGEAVGLARYGEVRVPPPSLAALIAWGRRAQIPVVGVDPPDDEYAGLFAQHIRYIDLVRRTVSERRVVRSPPSARTAEEFVLARNGAITRGRGSERLSSARDERTLHGTRALLREHGKVSLVVDLERYDALRHALG
jgi:hypothetical protein